MRCGNDPRITLLPSEVEAIQRFKNLLEKKWKEDQMATPKITPDIEENADVTVAPADWEWETVSEGAATRVLFDTIGDEFIGQLLGEEYIEREPSADGKDQSFSLYNFRGRDGELYAINQSYELVEAMAEVPMKSWVRIKYVKDVKTARNLNPMKSFKVDVRK